MEKESPEEMFAIKDSDKLESEKNVENIKVDGDTSSSEKKEDIDQNVKSNDFSLESLKEHVKKNNINIDDKTINNYYNQITDNKTYIQEYNKTIQQLGELKEQYDSKIEEKGDFSNSSEVSKKISSIEEKLANLNVEKQKKEDNIKNIINEIYNSQNNTSKVENISKVENDNKKNINFKSKNELLNLTINSTSEKVDKTQKIVERKQTIIPEKVEAISETKQEILPEKVEAISETKQEILPEKVEAISETKQEILPEKVEDSSFASVEKKEDVEEEPIKKETQDTSGMADMFKKLSDDMSKGFESILNALGNSSKEPKEESVQKTEEKKESGGKPSTYEDKPEKKQQNYIDDYRKSLRSNAPLEGMVGIKGLELKVNNIGSYV